MPSASSTSVMSAIGSAVSPFRGGRAPVAARNAPLARPPAASAAVPLLLVQPRQDHPQRRRFTVKLRWRQFGASSAMDVNLTAALDGSDLRLLCPATSHVMWQTTDQLYLSSKREWGLHAATGPRSIRLGRIGVGAIDLNVHLRQLPPAPHPDPPAYVYDIRGEGRVHVRLLAPATGKATQIGTVKAHGSPTVSFRCDPYPVTSADGCRVFVTSLQDGRRQLYCFERTGCPVAHRGAGRAAGSPAPQASGCGHGDRAACAPGPTASPRDKATGVDMLARLIGHRRPEDHALRPRPPHLGGARSMAGGSHLMRHRLPIVPHTAPVGGDLTGPLAIVDQRVGTIAAAVPCPATSRTNRWRSVQPRDEMS